MAFPTNPTDGQEYRNFKYDNTIGAWRTNNATPRIFPSDENLIAHYPLDEKNGVRGAVATYHLDGNALDTSGNGNHGTETDITYANNTAVFNGSTSYIDTGFKPKATEFSVSAWFRADSTITNQWKVVSNYEYHSGAGNSIGFNLGIPYANYDAFEFTINLGGYDNTGVAYKSNIMEEGVLYHAVGTFKGGEFVKLYLNGELVATDITDIPSSVDTTYDIKIGRRGEDDYFWNGSIDEINIFDRALSQEEITELYNNPSNTNLNSTELTTTNLIGKWDLNGDLIDTSGNGNDGYMIFESYVKGRRDNDCAYIADREGSYAVFGIGPGIITKDFTAFAWYRGTDNAKGIVSYGGTTYGFVMGEDLSTKVVCYLATEGYTGSFEVKRIIADDKWHSVCLTYNGEVAKLYIDGFLEKTELSYSGNLIATTNNNINLGNWEGE